MAVVRLHSGLYSAKAVQEAARSFSDYARVELSQEGEYWVARITDAETPESTLGREFANFALGLTVEQRGSL